ncbi:HNH endonuclease [Erysipelothrix enhydrae]|uniref:HNH endonuclease n=1 Tax=Erysipelothrix enhydrae TaxID=2890314 RepID=UPI002B2532F1|nr:HNH endonuclease [Erysipelothrix sp. 4322-04]WRB87232.1 HNH endonuclease [Erysipelothrix sp. 4322-04]
MPRITYKRDFRNISNFDLSHSEDVGELSYLYNKKEIRHLLREDFGDRCLYCGWDLFSYGGNYPHIEHLISQKSDEGKTLVDTYRNLVLSCSICNTTKRNNEIDPNYFPYKKDYRKIMYRTSFGAIVPNRDVTKEEQEAAQKIIKTIGLNKEIHKLDYVIDSLGIVKEKIKLAHNGNKYDSKQLFDKYLEVDRVIDVLKRLCIRNSGFSIEEDV